MRWHSVSYPDDVGHISGIGVLILWQTVSIARIMMRYLTRTSIHTLLIQSTMRALKWALDVGRESLLWSILAWPSRSF